MDEAMHPLTLLAVGLYGEVLPNQNGAPLRLVVPWKYGFKSIKSIVASASSRSSRTTTWNMQTPREYGFYSNVNPDGRPPALEPGDASAASASSCPPATTLMFNGYGDQVASLYAGMDLKQWF